MATSQSNDTSESPDQPHRFRDDYDSVPLLGSLFRGGRTPWDSMVGSRGRCSLCGRTADDSVHADAAADEGDGFRLRHEQQG